MKKWITAILCLAIMACTIPTAVIAESGDDQEITQTATTTSSLEGPTTTKKASYIFSFSSTENKLTVNWNADENPGVKVVSVTIGSKTYTINDSTGTFSVDISDLNPGYYTLVYNLSTNRSITADCKVVRGGDLSTSMTLKISNGYIEAALTDANNQPISNYPIRVYIDGSETTSGKTNANGIFSAEVPSSYTEIKCIAENSTVGSLKYIGCEKSLTSGGKDTPTNQTQASVSKVQSTSSTAKVNNSDTKNSDTTASTYAMINGAGTTSVDGNNIAVNVSFDSQVAKNFGCSNTDFEARSRLIVSKEAYASIVGTSPSALMMLAKTPLNTVTPHNISSFISNKSDYSKYEPEDTEIVPLDLSLILGNSVDSKVSLPATEVTVVLPVPTSMKDTSKYKIVAAVYDNNGITQIIDADVNDGSIQFKTDHLSTIALLGFKTTADSSKGAGIPTQSIILIIAGILLLGGAFTLLYFFFLRKPLSKADDYLDDTMAIGDINEYHEELGNDDTAEIKAASEPEPEQKQADKYPEDNGIDIYSGAPLKDKTPSDKNSLRNEPSSADKDNVSGISLGNMASHPQNNPKKKNPSDYNIDL